MNSWAPGIKETRQPGPKFLFVFLSVMHASFIISPQGARFLPAQLHGLHQIRFVLLDIEHVLLSMPCHITLYFMIVLISVTTN